MTCAAPSERISSTLPVLHTPVTSAPSATAIWTAYVPTPPAAPLTSTRCPARTSPTSRIPRSAVAAAIGTAAACSKVSPAGLGTTLLAAAVPATRCLGRLSPLPSGSSRAISGSPRSICQSYGFSAAACTRTRTSSGPIPGRPVSTSRRTSGGPNRSWTIAFITSPLVVTPIVITPGRCPSPRGSAACIDGAVLVLSRCVESLEARLRSYWLWKAGGEAGSGPVVLQVRLLGGVSAVTDQGESADIGPAKCQALLAALALSAGKAVPVWRLTELIWGEEPPQTADRTLQSYATRLRKGLGSDSIIRAGAAYRLNVAPDAVDVVRFQRQLDAGDVDAALAEWSG